MKTANINTLQSFCMNLKKYCISEADDEKFVYCFRGHKSTDFKYIPSILREGNEKYLEHIEEIQKEVINQFPEKFNSFENLTSEDIALMQHYGIATHYLDITFNPFVALFFASESLRRADKIVLDGEVAIIKVPKENVVFSEKEISDKNSNGTYLIKSSLNNPRIKAQNGAFLKFLDETKEIPEDWFVLKTKIANSKKKQLRKELAIMNITESTLFPELENFSSEIKRKYLTK